MSEITKLSPTLLWQWFDKVCVFLTRLTMKTNLRNLSLIGQNPKIYLPNEMKRETY